MTITMFSQSQEMYCADKLYHHIFDHHLGLRNFEYNPIWLKTYRNYHRARLDPNIDF